VAKLTDEERQQIRAAFNRLADIQADAVIAKIEAANTALTIDVPGDPWQHFGGRNEA
jgi:hypothetical protein